MSWNLWRYINKKYRAIFFDRDGTLTYFNHEKEIWRDKIIASWSGKSFDLPYEKMVKLFLLSAEGRNPWYKNLDDERAFFQRIYRNLLIDEGVTESLEERAELLFSELWCNHDRLLFSKPWRCLNTSIIRAIKWALSAIHLLRSNIPCNNSA